MKFEQKLKIILNEFDELLKHMEEMDVSIAYDKNKQDIVIFDKKLYNKSKKVEGHRISLLDLINSGEEL